MTAAEFFDKLLPYYRSMYDMEQPYTLNGLDCLAHGHFYSHSEKYVLSREAKLWESNNFEHVYFVEAETVGEDLLARMDHEIREYVEPVVVRNGKKYPEPNHMYTYVSFVFLSNGPVTKEIVKAVKKYHFTRNYLFTIRGWCEARVVLVDLSDEKIYTNRAGASLAGLFKKLLSRKKTVIRAD